MKYRLLVSIFLTLCLAACGGGNSGVGGSAATQQVPAPAPRVETMKVSTEIGGYYNMPSWMAADSPDGFLYVTTDNGLLQVDKGTGGVRTLAGYNKDVYTPSSVLVSGKYLYAGDSAGRVVGAYTGSDGLGGMDLLYNGHLPGAFNTGEIFGNSTALFYMADDGVYTMAYGDYHNSTLVTPYPAATSTIAVTENEIFFSAYPMSIYRFDLRSRQMQLLRSGIQNQSGNGRPVMAWRAPYLYWVDGTNLDRYNAATSQIERVATTLPPYVSQLAADDATVYANAAGGSPPMLDKVDVASGVVSEICPSSLIEGIAAGDGSAFFVSNRDIYQITGNDPPRRILSGVDFNVGGVQRGGFAYDHGFLFMNTMLSSGEKMLVHELATHSTTVYTPTHPVESFFYHDKGLYVYTGSGSGALVRIPLDKPLRKLVEFSSSEATPGTVKSLAADDSNIYWMYKGRYDGAFKVMKVAKDSPGAGQQLFQSSSELRDLAIHNGRLYFSCLDSCGRRGWVMASLAPDGGPVTAEVPLADDPKSFYLNGAFYVADTADHQYRSLYRLDLERAAAKLLLRELPYSGAPATKDLTIKASSKWLYVGSYPGSFVGSYEGSWTMKIARYQILRQGTLGSEEVIVGRPGDDVRSLMPMSISTDGVYLYFWDGALKRVAE